MKDLFSCVYVHVGHASGMCRVSLIVMVGNVLCIRNVARAHVYFQWTLIQPCMEMTTPSELEVRDSMARPSAMEVTVGGAEEL